MVLCEFAPHIIANACTEKCTYHLGQSTAKQECERSAGKCRRKAQNRRRVKSVYLFDIVKFIVDLFASQTIAAADKIVDEIFKTC